MALYNYKKYKISQSSDSKKTQGLKAGDIVRRQYFDAPNLIYTLMVVLNTGTEEIDGKERSFFIGALLEGDAPQQDQLLDFVRITSVYDPDRTGALYLTASDQEAPFMDVIDGLVSDNALTYPTSINKFSYVDPVSQYVVQNQEYVDAEYIASQQDVRRICKMTTTTNNLPVKIKQDFSKYIQNTDRILVSYRIKSNNNFCNVVGKIGYSDGTLIDGEWVDEVTDEWKYVLRIVQAGHSGRYLRSFELGCDELSIGDSLCIADLSVVLLSDVANFTQSTKSRIGKLDGVRDSVFGKLSGYGAYIPRLYATKSVNIAGTLAAGDEDGVGATFYAGKIRKNELLNSLDCNFSSANIREYDPSINVFDVPPNDSPTGLGKTFALLPETEVIVQSAEWLETNAGKKVTFSCWLYTSKPQTVSVYQNDLLVGEFEITVNDINTWGRFNTTFPLAFIPSQDLRIKLNLEETEMLFSAPQLEFGDTPTVYQATDSVLSESMGYGVWGCSGGFGGTMQNPLLKLNFDGQGAIGTASQSFLIRQDGSGYLANRNIAWDAENQVTFGSGIKLSWSNLDESAQQSIASKSLKIIGQDAFIGASGIFTPETITLQVSLENIPTSVVMWSYLNGSEYVSLGNGQTMKIFPDKNYWKGDSLVIKASVQHNNELYSDTITIRKTYNIGYQVQISSSAGNLFSNGECSTILRAEVLLNGAVMGSGEVAQNIDFSWVRYELKSSQLDESWSANTQEIEITNLNLEDGYKYRCEISLKI